MNIYFEDLDCSEAFLIFSCTSLRVYLDSLLAAFLDAALSLFWMPHPEPEEKTFHTKFINLGLSTIKDNTSRLPQTACAIVHASSSWRERGRESLCSPGRWVGRSGRQVGRLGGCLLLFG